MINNSHEVMEDIETSSVKGISVVICCYNSVDRLPATLQHLSGQRVPASLDWEVVLVDNNSTDATAQVAEQQWHTLAVPTPLTVVRESRQGLIHARLTGVQAARYEYIIFCDDDNWLCPDYLTESFRIMASNPAIGACGGQGVPEFGGHKPAFFDGCAHGYATGPQNQLEGPVRGNTLYGAGLVIRRSILIGLLQAGFRTRLSGRTGKSLAAGDDGELTALLKILGYVLWYSPKLSFYHYLPANRLQWSYISTMFRKFGESNGILQPYYALAEQTSHRSWSYHFVRRVYYTLRRLANRTSLREKYIILLMDATMLRVMIGQRKSFTGTVRDLLDVQHKFDVNVTAPVY
jgi:glycosyltransferase involved in cell wall biosynthesis